MRTLLRYGNFRRPAAVGLPTPQAAVSSDGS
jgi:hypothetical protein